jgi:hypothetical protein
LRVSKCAGWSRQRSSNGEDLMTDAVLDLSLASSAAPAFEFVFAAQINIGPKKALGPLPSGGDRYVVDILDGVFEGPNIRGRVLPGGADWAHIRPDGVFAFDARYTLQEDDGTFIYLQNRGYRWGTPEAMERMAKRLDVDPADYYMRVSPVFEVQAGKHDWLTRYVFFGVADKIPSGNIIRYFRVL